MDLPPLIEALRRPAAYPFAVAHVELIQTHISLVFLAGDWVYKIKKPVNLGFLDFSTLAKRKHYCAEEVRLNRRLAPAVYLGVVPITESASGLRVEGEGEPVEWAVKMARLPDEHTLLSRLQHNEVTQRDIESLARRIAQFHAGAARGEHIAEFGRFEVVAANARENFDQCESHVGITVSRPVFERLRELTKQALAELRSLIEVRAARGMPRDTHGDLHLDHVYLFPDQPSPGDLVIVDCIEFNERFRFADPVMDMAFLVMDLRFAGRRDLADAFAGEYFRASGDVEGRSLLPFCTAYRAVVRGKVEGMAAQESEVAERDRLQARSRACAHWLLALGELEAPERRPCLILVGGLPGTGKSTLARGLAGQTGLHVIRSDEVRKELAGSNPAQDASFGGGIYSPEWTERTYAECWRRAEQLLLAGERVLVDASFRADRHRRLFLEAAARLAVPCLLFLCHAAESVVRGRLLARHGDVSDADWTVYQQAAARWEPPSAVVQPALHELATNGPPADVCRQALTHLTRAELAALPDRN